MQEFYLTEYSLILELTRLQLNILIIDKHLK